MKLAILAAAIAVISNSFSVASYGVASDQLEKCIQERCPSEYSKCLSTSGCKAKLEKCENKCGAKIDYTCWSLCIGLPGAAANVANCAVKQGCLSNGKFGEYVEAIEEIAEEVMEVLNH